MNFLKTVFLAGIFGLLLLSALNDSDHLMISEEDPSVLIDLIADSGNVNPHGAFDEKLLETRKILLTTDINANSTKLVVASLLILEAANPDEPIDLYVRTNGGYYDDAFAVVDIIRTLKAPVNTYALGGCHSSGTLIVACGTGKRVAFENSLLMVHDNLSVDDGQYGMDTHENTRMREFWDGFKALPSGWISTPGDDLRYINAKQALEMGLIDTISKP